MRFSCTKENIAKALMLVSGVAGKNINLPILNNVLIKADQQKVEVVATNLEMATVVNIRAITEMPGSFTVPAKTLADFVNLLGEEKISFELKENELVVECGKSSTKIKGTPAEDFPIIPAVDEGIGYVATATELKRGLSHVIPATAKNDIRPELSGVYMGFNVEPKKLIMAATDSYRLAEKKISLVQGDEEKKIIVPGRTALEISRILSLEDNLENEKNARVLVGEGQIALHYGNVQMVSRLIEGQYPDYRQIIPKEFKASIEIETDKLIKEIKAASLFSTSGVNAVHLTIKPSEGLEIVSTSTQTGDYRSELEGEVSGETVGVLLNHRYLLDGLNNIESDKVKLKVINADSPCELTPKEDGYLYIVMPIRQ
ncbi:MAG TPA: DNA polymerase III subunit beta [Patescibacteria group bacterium]|nr:DNA polymerase III subunit beta [Patescibacteria group bacterium]